MGPYYSPETYPLALIPVAGWSLYSMAGTVSPPISLLHSQRRVFLHNAITNTPSLMHTCCRCRYRPGLAWHALATAYTDSPSSSIARRAFSSRLGRFALAGAGGGREHTDESSARPGLPP